MKVIPTYQVKSGDFANGLSDQISFAPETIEADLNRRAKAGTPLAILCNGVEITGNAVTLSSLLTAWLGPVAAKVRA